MCFRHPFLYPSLSFHLPPLYYKSLPVLSNLFQGEILFIPKVAAKLSCVSHVRLCGTP